MKINSNETVSADLKERSKTDATVINLNRITLEKVTQSSDSSDSENDDFVGNDEAEKVNEVVKKGRATPNSIILSMTSTKSSSYNRMETLPEIVQEGSSSGSLKIKIKIPQNVN